jgi:ankyrin repeat protein
VATNGDIAISQDSILKGVDVNQAGYFENSALDRATEGGHDGVVRLMLAAGADISKVVMETCHYFGPLRMNMCTSCAYYLRTGLI